MRPAVLEKRAQSFIVALIALGLGAGVGAMYPEVRLWIEAQLHRHPSGYSYKVYSDQVIANEAAQEYYFTTSKHPGLLTTVYRVGGHLVAATRRFPAWDTRPVLVREPTYDERKIWHQLFGEIEAE